MMFNRRKFLAGLLSTPAAALVPSTERPSLRVGQTLWVIVGVNWEHNDEFFYGQGDSLTEYAFTDKVAAEMKCADLIRQFRRTEDPEDFVKGDLTVPDAWEAMTPEQQWDWLWGISGNPQQETCACDDGFGWVEMPFEVRAMLLPDSALRQLSPRGERS